VAELFVDREFGGPLEASALAGVLVPAGEHTVFDVAVRGTIVDGVPAFELRAGLTWAISFFGEPARPEAEEPTRAQPSR
jgi:hypothetical protein